MQSENKIFHFEFVLKKLLEWYEVSNAGKKENDLSVLKALKLLFFVAASNSEKDSSELLENVFDNFVAMPYGHVESDVYTKIRNTQGSLNFYVINNVKTNIKADVNISELENKIDSKYKIEIESAVNTLKRINPNLINLSAFELVDLSHAWYSWKMYHVPYRRGISSQKIPTDVIKKEDKIFSLQMM